MGGTPLLMIAAQPTWHRHHHCHYGVRALSDRRRATEIMTLLAVVDPSARCQPSIFPLLHTYQLDRLFSFFNPTRRTETPTLLYEVNNAKSAIGSGGIHGAGLFADADGARLRCPSSARTSSSRRLGA